MRTLIKNLLVHHNVYSLTSEKCDRENGYTEYTMNWKTIGLKSKKADRKTREKLAVLSHRGPQKNWYLDRDKWCRIKRDGGML